MRVTQVLAAIALAKLCWRLANWAWRDERARLWLARGIKLMVAWSVLSVVYLLIVMVGAAVVALAQQVM